MKKLINLRILFGENYIKVVLTSILVVLIVIVFFTVLKLKQRGRTYLNCLRDEKDECNLQAANGMVMPKNGSCQNDRT